MKVDIISQEEIKNGKAYKVKSDPILELIATIKKKLKTYQGNELYVKEESLEKYKEIRKNFEKSVQFFAIVVVALLIVFVVLPILNGSWGALLSGFALTVLLSFLMFALILKNYIPAIEDTPEEIGDGNGEQD